MLDDFGQRIRDIILSEMDLSRELSDEEITFAIERLDFKVTGIERL